MNAKLSPSEFTPPSTSQAIQARIDSEQQRLATEQEFERSLTAELDAALLNSTDADLEELEERIRASSASQARIAKRLEILGTQLADAQNKEVETQLDEMEAKLRSYRDFGTSLYERYDQLAGELGSLLGMLEACNLRIGNLNQQLKYGGRMGMDSLYSAHKLYSKIDLMAVSGNYHWRKTDDMLPYMRMGVMEPLKQNEQRQEVALKQLDIAMAAASKPTAEQPKAKKA